MTINNLVFPLMTFNKFKKWKDSLKADQETKRLKLDDINLNQANIGAVSSVTEKSLFKQRQN